MSLPVCLALLCHVLPRIIAQTPALPASCERKRRHVTINKYTESDVTEEMPQQLMTVSFETLHPTPLGQ
jgi:hypothetical protein